MNASDNEAAQSIAKFCRRLEETHVFPCDFVFKFIVPVERSQELEQTLAEALDLPPSKLPCSRRQSRNERYLSLTLETCVQSSEQVTAIYQRAATVPNLIAL